MQPSATGLRSATVGFDLLFLNDLNNAKLHFSSEDDAYHLLGQGVCTFMEAALGMESNVLAEAARCLSLAEAAGRKQLKNPPKPLSHQKYPPGLEWEILIADAIVLLGLTNALGESYMGYLQCMYSLNNAHTRFSRLYKTVFPNGIDDNSPNISTASSPLPSRKPSIRSLNNAAPALSLSSPSSISLDSTTQQHAPKPALGGTKSFFSRLTSYSSGVSPASSSVTLFSTSTASTVLPETSIDPALAPALRTNGVVDLDDTPLDPVEDLIVAGTAFGFGLFNLVFSLLPKKVQSLVGILGFKHDRKLALRALALSASKSDVHSVFAGLVLMTYHGVVLLLSGYQADEEHIVRQYKAIVDKIEQRYPDGTLWILNRAKILRMTYDPEAAIRVLQHGLRPDRTHHFAQADTLLAFELAWTFLGQRKYQEAADMFTKLTELNSWSHGTYYFLAAGCYISLGNTYKAQSLLDAIPDLMIKKISGKDLPTEVFIKKKLAFYQEKQKRRGGDAKLWAEAIKISLAEELGIFWNTHARIERRLALAHIKEWSALTPPLPLSVAVPPTALPSPLLSPMSPLNVPNNTSSNRRTPRAYYGFSHALHPMPAPVIHRSSSSSSHTDAATSDPKEEKDMTNTKANVKGDNPKQLPDIDTPDEAAVRHLLVGICERTAGAYDAARESLKAACALQSEIKVSTWVGSVAMFELGVLELKELEAKEQDEAFGATAAGVVVNVGDNGSVHGAVKRLAEWDKATKSATKKLEAAMALAGSSVDLSSRLDTRVSMLRDEIANKRALLGLQN